MFANDLSIEGDGSVNAEAGVMESASRVAPVNAAMEMPVNSRECMAYFSFFPIEIDSISNLNGW